MKHIHTARTCSCHHVHVQMYASVIMCIYTYIYIFVVIYVFSTHTPAEILEIQNVVKQDLEDS